MDFLDDYEGCSDIDNYNCYSSLLKITESITSENDNNYFIKYEDKSVCKFSFKLLMKAMYELSTKSQIQVKDIKDADLIYEYDQDKHDYTPVNGKVIGRILKELRNSLKTNPEFKELVGKEIL